MCKDCGCEDGGKEYFGGSAGQGDLRQGEKHTHDHSHDHKHPHKHKHSHEDQSRSKVVRLEEDLLAHNNEVAHKNRHWFEDHNIRVVNLISAPGSGKTALLEQTVVRLKEQRQLVVLVGDQQTDHDAQRILNIGANVKQINTYSSCHLDARMIERELGTFVSGAEDLLIIENIGNLVCPAAFDLGEDAKVALLSTTEGEDKPIKYPVLFNNASLVVITKMDLAPHLDWSLEKTLQYIKQVNAKVPVICTSAKTGEGVGQWCDWLLKKD